MKRKWLIAIASLAMAITFVLGVSACKNDGKSDEEIAQTAINTLNSLYLKDGAVKNYETPDNYTVLGQVNVDGTVYPVTWTPTAKTQGVNIADYVTVGENDSKGQVTIGITRTTVDVEYTLTASVTAGKETKTAEYGHKIPKKSSEDAVTATLDLSTKNTRTTYDADNNEQVWKQNGVTLTNTGNVGDFAPIRLYKNTTVNIEMENARIIHIDFHSAQGYDDSPYPEYLQTSLTNSDLPIKGDLAVSEDGLTISVDFETPQEIVTFKTTAGQCRLTSIDVEAIERDPNEHVHKWTYEHIANTWTHKATCTAEGCDVNTKTESCTPKLNVCECGYTYSAKEVVDALFALETGKSLPGTYSLTGVVTEVTELDTTNFKNVTFDMTVEGRTITVYRAKGAHYSEVAVGGTATVNGELLDYGGKKEFTTGGSVVEFTPGVDDRTPQEKVNDALKALEATFTVTKTGETALPTSTVNGVTFTWSTEDETYTISDNKINVTALPAADATVAATVTATYGTETVTNNTKQVTITIKAESSATEGFTPITAPAAGSDYYLAMDRKGTWYYSTGAMAGHYLGSTTDISGAAKVTVAPSGSGWTLVTNGKYIEIEVGDYNNIVLKDSQTAGKVWDWDATHAVFTMTVGSDSFFMGTFGDYDTFNACYVSYLENDNEYIGKIGTYTGSTEPQPGKTSASLSFADVANRTEGTTTKQVWEQNGITFTNEGSVNPDYYAPVRLYKNSTVKIEYTSAFKKIVFHSVGKISDSDYPGDLKTTLEALSGATVTVSGNDITLELATAQNSVEFTASQGQLRLNSIDVYTEGGSQPSQHEHNYTYQHTAGAWTHTGTCSSADCPQPTVTEDCTPQLNRCPVCGYTYTVDEILTALSKLASNQSLAGTYSLTGVVTGTVTPGNNNAVKFDMLVDGETVKDVTVQAYYVSAAAGVTITGLKAGDKVTIEGALKKFNTTLEFDGGTITNVVVGELSDADKVTAALKDLSLPKVVNADFALPVSSVEGVQFAFASNKEGSLKAEGNQFKVVRGTEDVSVTVTVTATCGSESGTKTLTVTVKAAVAEGQTDYLLTVDSLNIPSGKYTASGNATVGGTAFDWANMGSYGDGLQWRTSNSQVSSIWNAAAFEKNITKVVLVWASTKSLPTKQNVLKVEFADNAQFTGAVSQTVTFSSDKTLEITVDGDYQFVRFTHNNQGAVYLDEITILCGKATTDADKVASALNAVEDTLTVAVSGNYALPVSTVEDVVFSWKSDSTVFPVEGNELKIAELPAVKTTVTLTLTAECGNASATKTVTVTIAAKPVEIVHEGTAESPYTVAEAIALCENLAEGNYYLPGTQIKGVYITGYVTAIGEFTGKDGVINGLKNISIAAEAGSSVTLKVVVVYWNSVLEQPANNINPLHAGDMVVVYGFLQQNSGAAVNEYGTLHAQLAEWTPRQLTDEEKVADALAALVLPTEATEDVALPVSVVEGVSLAWQSSQPEVMTVASDHLTVVRPSENTVVTVTVTASLGEATAEKTFSVKVIGEITLTGSETVAAVVIDDYAEEHHWIPGMNYLAHTEILFGERVSLNLSGSATGSTLNSGKYFTAAGGGQWRVYQNEAPQIVFTAKDGAKIYTIKFTYTAEGRGVLANESGTVVYESGAEIAVNDTRAVFTLKNTSAETEGLLNITAIEVVYERGVSADEQKIASALSMVGTLSINEPGSYKLPASGVKGVVFSWTSPNAAYPVAGGILKVNDLPEYALDLVLTLTATCNGATGSKSVIVKIKGTSEGGHEHSYQYKDKDEQYHTVTCDTCDWNQDELHEYTDDQDTTCDKCGHTRTIVSEEEKNRQKVTEALAKVSDTMQVTEQGNVALPTSDVEGVSFAWKTDSNDYPVDNNVLQVSELPEKETQVTLTLTATCGNVSMEKTVTVTIAARPEETVPDGTYEHDITVDASQAELEKEELEDLFVNKDESVITGVTAASGVYAGNSTTGGPAWSQSQGNFLRLGSSKNGGSLTLTFEKPVSLIKIKCCAWDSDVTINLTAENVAAVMAIASASESGLSKTAPEFADTTTEQWGEVVFILPEPANSVTISTSGSNQRILVKSITAQIGEVTDLQKAEAARDEFMLEQTEYDEVNDYTLPTEYEGATISWSMAASSQSCSLSGSTLKVTHLPEEDEKVVLTATFTVNGQSATKEIEIIVKKDVSAVNYGSEQAPLSVSQTLELVQTLNLGKDEFTQQPVYMIGIVKETPTEKTSSTGTYYQGLYLLDENETSKEFYVYTINLKDGVAAPAQNDVLIICGYITNYQGKTIEFAGNGSTYVNALQNTRGESTISTEVDGATVSGLPESNKANNGTTVTFTVKPDEGKKISSVKVYGEALTSTDGTTYTFTMKGNVTIKVEAVAEDAKEPLEAKIEHSGATSNLSGDNDANSIFGLDASIFTIQSEKTNNGNNHVGLNKDGTIRLYKNKTATLHIKVSTAYIIQSITVTTADSNAKLDKLNVEVNSKAVAGPTEAVTTYTYQIDNTAVSLSNNDASKQIYIKSIVITYQQVGETGPEPGPEPQPTGKLYTLTANKKGTNSDYKSSCNIEVDGITWNVEANTTLSGDWGFGGKNITNTDRKLSSTTALQGKVGKVVITFGKNSGITVNSVTFNVYKSNPTVTGATVAFTRDVAYTANGSVTLEANSEDWSNCFYQLVFNVTAGSSNKYVTVSTIEFYA